MKSISLFINNFNFVSDLLVSKKHTNDQKNDLIRRFDDVKNLTESKKIFKQLKKEYGKERDQKSFV
jgi:hypothetical protein